MSVDELRVTISYKDLKTEFSGKPDEVYRSIISFMEKAMPAYSLASKIVYSVDITEILEKLKDVIGYTASEGLFLLKPLSSFSISEAILLVSLKKYLEQLLGIKESQTISLSEMSKDIGRPEKPISRRLSELVQKGYLKRLERGDYSITHIGIKETLRVIEQMVTQAD